MENQRGKNLIKGLGITILVILVFATSAYFDLKNHETSKIANSQLKQLKNDDSVNNYLSSIAQSIDKNLSKANIENSKAAYFVMLDKNGNIIGYNLMRPTKSSSYEKATLTSIIQAAPFGKLPNSIKDKELALDIEFDNSDVEVMVMRKSANTIGNVLDERSTMLICQALDDNSVEMKNYTRNLEKEVKQLWKPSTNFDSRVVVNATIANDGHVKHLSYETQSHNPLVFQEAVKAVQNASFEPFPSSVKSEQENFRFSFLVMNEKTKS